tara:strand:- start:3480 stop:3695 length:216 start_codon:yes stop_codon:yes gene_type:complete
MKKGDLVKYNFNNIWCKRLGDVPLAAPPRGMLGVVLKAVEKGGRIEIFVKWVDNETNWYFDNELFVIEETD